MSSSKDYLEYVLDQLSDLEDISSRAMMGEYIIYYRGKIIGGIYDDRFLVKPVKAAKELMPDADVLRKIGADKVDDLDVAAMLEAINERITFLYDREHTIGHAFFTKLKDAPTLETLKTIFKKSVIPLLQEYFYEDYQKIQLVLGDNGKTDDSLKFITDEKVVIRNIFKGRAEDVIDIDRKYSINDAAFDNLESYKQIK